MSLSFPASTFTFVCDFHFSFPLSLFISCFFLQEHWLRYRLSVFYSLSVSLSASNVTFHSHFHFSFHDVFAGPLPEILSFCSSFTPTFTFIATFTFLSHFHFSSHDIFCRTTAWDIEFLFFIHPPLAPRTLTVSPRVLNKPQQLHCLHFYFLVGSPVIGVLLEKSPQTSSVSLIKNSVRRSWSNLEKDILVEKLFFLSSDLKFFQASDSTLHFHVRGTGRS